jgi:hypothetical protein
MPPNPSAEEKKIIKKKNLIFFPFTCLVRSEIGEESERPD